LLLCTLVRLTAAPDFIKVKTVSGKEWQGIHRIPNISTNALWIKKVKKVKYSRYRSGVAQRVGRLIALLFNDRALEGDE